VPLKKESTDLMDEQIFDPEHEGKCLRIFNRKGEHVASLMICLDGDDYDLAYPNGKVIMCGITLYTANDLGKLFGWEDIEEGEASSYFPICILLVDTKEVKLCYTPEEVPGSMTFKVLKTRVNFD